MNTLDKITSLIETPINEIGYILDEVLYEKEGKLNFLRVIIDKQGFINIDDCVVVSKLVSELLDKDDPIDEEYILDVCSKEKGSV